MKYSILRPKAHFGPWFLSVFASLGFLSNLAVSLSADAKIALIYNGKGACKECFEAAAFVAKRSGFEVNFIGANGIRSAFKNIDVYIQPGGLALDAEATMSTSLKQAVTSYVSEGGAYFGICAGAFLAVSRMHIDGENKAGFGFVEGDSYVYEKVSETPTVLEIDLQGQKRDLFWYWGPYFKFGSAARSAIEIIAYNPDKSPVGFRGNYGQGKFLAIGVHPEAPEEWRKGVKAVDRDGLDYDTAGTMLDWLTAAP